jgi:hypothetical protein
MVSKREMPTPVRYDPLRASTTDRRGPGSIRGRGPTGLLVEQIGGRGLRRNAPQWDADRLLLPEGNYLVCCQRS